MKKVFTTPLQYLFSCIFFITGVSKAQPVRKVLIEEFTTASCGNCPMMSQYIRTWHEAHAANSIMVSIHEGSGVDAMSNSNTAAIFNAMHPTGSWFAPATMIERAIYPSTGGEAYLSCYQSWGSPGGPGVDSIATRLMNEPPVVGIEISGVYNAVTRSLDATVSAEFLQTVPAGDWRINLFLVEDSVTGWPGLGAFTGWDQHCYDANWANTWYPGMFDGTSIIGYPHRHVMRNSMLGNWGAAGVIPSVPVLGMPYTTSASISVDTAYNEHHLSLVAFVSSYGATKADKFILNANDITVTNNFSTGIFSITDDFGVQLYPVPASERITVSYSLKKESMTTIEMHDVSGRMLTSATAIKPAGRNHSEINIQDLQKGIYFISIETPEGKSIKKLVVE